MNPNLLFFSKSGSQSQGNSTPSNPVKRGNWNRVWQLCIAVMASMLRTLRHGFLKEALDFAGVHRERLAQVSKHSNIFKWWKMKDSKLAARWVNNKDEMLSRAWDWQDSNPRSHRYLLGALTNELHVCDKWKWLEGPTGIWEFVGWNPVRDFV